MAHASIAFDIKKYWKIRSKRKSIFKLVYYSYSHIEKVEYFTRDVPYFVGTKRAGFSYIQNLRYDNEYKVCLTEWDPGIDSNVMRQIVSITF